MDSWIPRAYQEAEPSRWEALCRGLRSSVQARPWDASDMMIAGLVLLVAVSVVGVLAYFLVIRDRRQLNGPRRLFLSLCRAHGLTWRERWWLWRLARSQQLREPARLFLEPDRFRTSQFTPGLRKHSAPLGQLRERLFRETAKPLAASEAGSPDGSPRPTTPLPPAAAPPTFDLPSLPADPLASR